MTAVVGILNKKGVAIAADSAVTRRRDGNMKITKNGNKMVRMSNDVPIAVMITGSAMFLGNPWDVVVRQYRKESAGHAHATVEDCVHDFFRFISTCDPIWANDSDNRWFENIFEDISRDINFRLDFNVLQTDKCGNLTNPEEYESAFVQALDEIDAELSGKSMCRGFMEMADEDFQLNARRVIEMLLKTQGNDEENAYWWMDRAITLKYIDKLLAIIKRQLAVINDSSLTTLVFAGYGASEEYPSLIAVNVSEGYARIPNYHISDEDIVKISDERPAAICPYAQTDVVNAILTGVAPQWEQAVDNDIIDFISLDQLSNEIDNDDEAETTLSTIDPESYRKLIDKYDDRLNKIKGENKAPWIKALQNYDIKSMAALAQSLIDLTGFQRILTFSQEGVGGDVDLAVITLNEGFTWLNRKSWYHHKDIGGKYGSMGV